LSVEVRTPADLELRVEVVRRRDAFERDPEQFMAAWRAEDAAVQRRVVSARSGLGAIEVPDSVRRQAARLCMALGTDGLRGELTLIRAARAAAALEHKKQVSEAHIRQVAASALRHRLRRDPLDETGSTTRVERAATELFAP